MIDPMNEYTKAGLFTLVMGLGGALSFVYRQSRLGKSIKWGRVLLSALLVAFICFHLGLLYQELGMSERMIWAINGFSSVLGVEFLMAVVQKLLLSKLGITDERTFSQTLIDAGWTPPNSGGSITPVPAVPEAGADK